MVHMGDMVLLKLINGLVYRFNNHFRCSVRLQYILLVIWIVLYFITNKNIFISLLYNIPSIYIYQFKFTIIMLFK